MSIFNFWDECTRLSQIDFWRIFLEVFLDLGSEFCNIVICLLVQMFMNFSLTGMLTDNLKHLLSSNTCICSNTNEKCHLSSQTVVHSKQNSPPITQFLLDNNILRMKISQVAEQVLPINPN